MIKVTVFYPNIEGKRFDIDYYCNTHMPMAQRALGAACKGVAVDQGLSGGEPGAPAPYIAISYLFFETIESFHTAIGPVMEQLSADMPNYTDLTPSYQISQVKL